MKEYVPEPANMYPLYKPLYDAYATLSPTERKRLLIGQMFFESTLFGGNINVFLGPKSSTDDGNYMYSTHTRHINEQSSQYDNYILALQRASLNVVTVAGDGNCLFRSVAHQVYGDDDYHDVVRQNCMDHMEKNADFFSRFVEGGMDTFHLYLADKRKFACWGDDPEIRAMSELYDRPVEIWAYDQQIGARKLRTFHEATSATAPQPPIRLSYYGGSHYDSVCDIDHQQAILQLNPGAQEDNKTRSFRANPLAVNTNSEREALDTAVLNAALKMSREECLISWTDKDLQTLLLISLNLLDDASDKKPSSPMREDDKKYEQLHEDAMIDESSVEIISDIVATQSELLRNLRDESERSHLEDDLLQQACDASLIIDTFDLFIKYGITNKLNKYHPPILTANWIFEDGISKSILMHFPSEGLGGNVLKPHITLPIPRFRYLSECWGAVECATGLDLSVNTIPYNLEPFDNQYDKGCGGKVLNTKFDISLDTYFLELQTKLFDLLQLRVLISFGKKPHSFMSNNPYLRHSEYIDGPNCHPSCLIKLNKSRGATEDNKKGWLECAEKYGGDSEIIKKYEPTADEKERMKERMREAGKKTQFGAPGESEKHKDAGKKTQFGGPGVTDAQKNPFGGAKEKGKIFYKSTIEKLCKCGRTRKIGAAVYIKVKAYYGDCTCTKHIRYENDEVEIDHERCQQFRSTK